MRPAPGGADFAPLLRLLVGGRVDFIVVGGFAATAHGTSRVTYDLDVVYSRETANLARVVDSLANAAPYLRGAPPGVFHSAGTSSPSSVG